MIFEDFPDLICDLVILTNLSDDAKGSVWFVLSLAWSVAGFLGTAVVCTKGLMDDDKTTPQAPEATTVGQPAP
eukprot:NODE_28751_length_467_cov_2.550000.p5 GENE.NODE_28751_length_467_cov_2.550000~~NODE_28751_length_467_cov_2.550000.p5  ORF type:complete len:73 (-),score=21.48 NODE_28751_length_467_cov_2.550000:72-290(-)